MLGSHARLPQAVRLVDLGNLRVKLWIVHFEWGLLHRSSWRVLSMLLLLTGDRLGQALHFVVESLDVRPDSVQHSLVRPALVVQKPLLCFTLISKLLLQLLVVAL